MDPETLTAIFEFTVPLALIGITMRWIVATIWSYGGRS